MSLFPQSQPSLAPDVERGMGAKIAGGNPAAARQANDFYPTPPDVTRALLRREGERLTQIAAPIWEPCGRGGAMVREIEAHGFFTIGTDIVPDPANNVAELDVLEALTALSPVVVTNPPFSLSAKIILHLLGKLRVTYCALLLKSQYWHVESRTRLFAAHRPARIYALNWRPDFLEGGAPAMDCQWVVWDGKAETTSYDVLARVDNMESLL